MLLFGIIAFICLVALIVSVVKPPKSHDEVQKELALRYVPGGVLVKSTAPLLAKAEALRQAEIMNDEKTLSAIHNETYQGPWPEPRSGDGWLSIYDDLRILNVAGMNFRQGINRYKGFIDAALVPEPGAGDLAAPLSGLHGRGAASDVVQDHRADPDEHEDALPAEQRGDRRKNDSDNRLDLVHLCQQCGIAGTSVPDLTVARSRLKRFCFDKAVCDIRNVRFIRHSSHGVSR